MASDRDTLADALARDLRCGDQKEHPMTTPTPDEITAALDVLRRVPGVTDVHCLKDIVELASPIAQMARDLSDWYTVADPSELDLATELGRAAARHGLRIIPDPGELVGYSYVKPAEFDPGWVLIDDAGTWQPDDLAMAEEQAERGQRVVALYLPAQGAR